MRYRERRQAAIITAKLQLVAPGGETHSVHQVPLPLRALVLSCVDEHEVRAKEEGDLRQRIRTKPGNLTKIGRHCAPGRYHVVAGLLIIAGVVEADLVAQTI